MSFEGVYRIFCRNGHMEQYGIYDYSFGKEDTWVCSYCKEPKAYLQLVDLTNGYDEEAYKLECIQEEITKKCDSCGSIVVQEPARWKIPDNKNEEQ